MVDLGRQQKDFGVLELYKTRAMGSFPEMRYEETEVWTKDATGNVSSIAIWSTRSQRYTRCRNHGGLITGPKTEEGIERIRKARTPSVYGNPV
jgi:hypothetical protein